MDRTERRDGGCGGRGIAPQSDRISFSLQAFNALNRTNPIAVGTVFGSPFFGQPVLTDPGRRIELGVSLAF